MANEHAFLQFNEITKRFPGVTALDRVSFGIDEGNIHGLVGENGAGKSTLLKIAVGDIQRTSGEILFAGSHYLPRTPHDAKNLGINMIYQELNTVPDLTISENVFLGREIADSIGFRRKSQMSTKTAEILKALDLKLDPDMPVRSLSIAQSKMVEIARNIIYESKIVIMDEPTASISDHDVQILFDLIRNLQKRGITIVYVSHKLDEILQICNKVTVLRDGRHVSTQPAKDITKGELIRLMLDRELSEEYPRRRREPSKSVVLHATSLNYKKRVKGISLELKEGEILGIAGLVGSGRTELVKTLFGEYRKSSGSVFYRGLEIRLGSPVRSVKMGIAYISEDRKREGVFPSLPVNINIALGALGQISRFSLVDFRKLNEVASSFIGRLNIAARLGQLASKLSGGNQQKVLIARALAASADIFIFDEPTVGIDVGTKYQIREIINDLADNGKSVIIISAELEEVIELSDRVIVIRNGEKAIELDKGGTDELKEQVYAYAAGR